MQPISTFLIAGITPFDDLEFDSINLLTESKPGFPPPSFNIVNTSTFIQEITRNGSSALGILPPNFLLSLSYRPHDNTVLNLLSTKRITVSESLEDQRTRDTDSNLEHVALNSTAEEAGLDFASLILSTGILYVQQSLARYYTLWPSVEANQLHNVVFVVSNGSISSCVDGAFVEDNPNIVLWDTTVGLNKGEPVRVSFSKHLYSVQQLVSCNPLTQWFSVGPSFTREWRMYCCSSLY